MAGVATNKTEDGVIGTPPVEKWTPERRRQLTRDALLDAAAVVFARRGFHGASLDEIAETAGFTRGAIYKNFEGKEDLFLAVNARANERVLQDFVAMLEPGQPLDELDITALAAKWQELSTNDPDTYVLALEFQLYVLRNPEFRERSIAQRRATMQLVARFMESQAAASGTRLPLPVEDLANIYLITAEGFAMAAYADPDTQDLYAPFLELMIKGMASDR